MRYRFSNQQFGKAAACAALAGTILLVTAPPSHADWTRRTSCYVGGCTTSYFWGLPGGSLAAITNVPGPQTDEERAEAVERDRKWVAHCKPSLREDRYGMKRYVYEKPGCEFGKTAN